MNDRRDTARVIAPPPLIAVGIVLLGLALDKLSPVGLAGAVFPRSARFAIAAALIAFAAWPMTRALLRFRIAGTPAEPWKPTSALVVRGIYRRTRNPMYQAFGLFALGLAFAFASDWLFLLLPIGVLVIHVGVVRREERYLAAKFGDDYRDYCAKVPRYGWPISTIFPVAISSCRARLRLKGKNPRRPRRTSMTARRIVLIAALLAMSATIAPPALAQGDYPNKTIRIVVGFAAGGGNDIFARLVGAKLQELIGQPVIIENKPGAGARLANEYAANQPADGYTLLVAASGGMSIASAIYPKLGYHPTKSFVPLTMIANFPLILAIPEGHPARTVAELVAWMKANPDKSNYATSSPAFTIATELFKLKTGAPSQAIPYKSSGESLVAVMGGQTLLTIADGPPAVPLVKGGKVRALAVTGSERSDELPDVPSMKEVGFAEVNTGLWSGLFVPAATPAPIVKKLEDTLRRVIADPDVNGKLKAMAVTPGGGSSEEFRAMIDADIKTVAEVVKAANLEFKD